MALQGFGKNSGPSFPPRSPTLFGSSPATAATTATISNPPSSNESIPMQFTLPKQQQNHRLRSTPIRFVDDEKSPLDQDNSIAHQWSSEYHVTKGTGSPPGQSSNEVSISVSNFPEPDAEREIRAKAKRLARFGAELSQSAQGFPDKRWRKSFDVKHNQTQIDNVKISEDDSAIFTEKWQNGRILPDSESQDTAIVGLCQDMCPESERDERERKGDLDQYERLDGERNQTMKSLAVKKYNRMAERDAVLIRPMPVLQKTINYLLEIISQPYSSKFLGMYNFLWDRMRAIRMDLRMQHIFNQHAIVMLEQMIRLHIIAMHELCEYNKGEGFSEGFDAHLNIEQMNKTSVELFQMYDDHRKKGINIYTEKEFRGYYALLKLDKHPGYKVEPAELSLDLARMMPEIRGSQEVLFARDVARACRTGNFISFFRLARKSTYLQACLMHAHFAKLRTLALASLHSGLQNNQGIPVAHVVKWLGMEGEDIDDLLQYHGFAIKMFEDAYMVKENPFLRTDVDYPTKCSKLVHLKKSPKIVDDISSGPVISGFSGKKTSLSDFKAKFSHKAHETPVSEGNEFAHAVTKIPTLPDLTGKFSQRITKTHEFSSVAEKSVHKTIATSSKGWTDTDVEEMQNDSIMKVMELSATPTSTTFCESGKLNFEENNISSSFPVDITSIVPQPVYGQMGHPDESIHDKHGLTSTSPKGKQALRKSNADPAVKSPKVQKSISYLEETEKVFQRNSQHESAIGKLKIILRKWKEKASKRREIREQRLLLANLALNSISLGPPLRKNENHTGHAGESVDIGFIMRERDDNCLKSFSRLNVASVVGPILITKNNNSRCLCWKLLMCLHSGDNMVHKVDKRALTWLVSKLMGSETRDDDELVFSSEGLSIWKKLMGEVPDHPKSFCFSVVREVLFNNDKGESSRDLMAGANAIMYLTSESTPYDIQKIHLDSFLLSIPSGSRLPLLIVSCSVQMRETSDPQSVISRLGLLDADKTKISCVSVVFISGVSHGEQYGGFLSDINLKKGLQWLANQSPLQPTPRLVKTRGLVLEYLGSSLKLDKKMKKACLDPDDCVAIFNEALQQSANQIQSAAHMNPNCWPCPEIYLFKGSAIEKRIIETFLPKIGWSSAARIESIVAAINDCKLPYFSDNLLWLRQGSYMGKEILDQKQSLEKYLANYLVESAKILSGDLALKEAHLMLQTAAFLELRGSYYHIAPKWLMIFQRIYNWCLTRLTSKEIAFAYVFNHDEPITNEINPYDLLTSREYDIRGGTELNFEHDMRNLVPLDEMVELACCVPSSNFPAAKKLPERAAEVSGIVSHPSEIDKDTNLDYLHKSDDDFSVEQESETSPLSPLKGCDRLNSLLEKCNTIQNSMAEKLSFYF